MKSAAEIFDKELHSVDDRELVRPLLCVLLSTATIAFAAAEDLTTRDGRTYKGVTVSRVEADGINIVHATGAAKIPFEKLPDELQAKYHFDAKKALSYRVDQEAGRKLKEAVRQSAAEESAAKEAAEKHRAAELVRQKQAEQRNKKIVEAIVLIGSGLAGLFVYFLPAIVGARKRNAFAIFMLTLLAGWTLVGWIVAMVWACTRDPQEFAQRLG